MNEYSNQRPGPYRLPDDSILECIRGSAEYGKILVKSAMLVNGGAIVALLAFIGSVLPTGLEDSAISSLTSSLLLFFLGLAFVFVCAVCNIYAFNSFSHMHHKAVRTGKQYFEIEIVLLKRIRINAITLTVNFERLSYLLYALSFILFVCGVYKSFDMLFAVLSSQSNTC